MPLKEYKNIFIKRKLVQFVLIPNMTNCVERLYLTMRLINDYRLLTEYEFVAMQMTKIKKTSALIFVICTTIKSYQSFNNLIDTCH